MCQHAGYVVVRSSQPAMLNGHKGIAGVTVFSGQRECSQACNHIVKQLWKMSGALLVPQRRAVMFRPAICLCQPICN